MKFKRGDIVKFKHHYDDESARVFFVEKYIEDAEYAPSIKIIPHYLDYNVYEWYMFDLVTSIFREEE